MTQKSNTIKICFVAPKAYPLFNPKVEDYFGGAEVDLYLLAKHLAKNTNFAVSFVTADYGQDQTETIDNVRIIKSLKLRQNPLAGAIKIYKAMKLANADIYFQEASSPGTFLVSLFCRLKKRIFVYRTASERECNGTYIRQNPFVGRLFARALRQAAQVIVQNEKDAENIQQTIGVWPIVIPNAQDLPELSQTTRDKILWVGRSTKIKRPDLFLRLAEQFPEDNFVMICQRGTGDKDYQKLPAQTGDIANLDFVKRVRFDQVDRYFQTAKVLVNTSDSEGFPNTFIQACAAATPILTVNVNPDNFLTKYNCGMCANGDWNKFTEQLKMLLEPERAKQHGQNARKYAEEKHDIKRIIQTYKDLFSKLAQPDKT